MGWVKKGSRGEAFDLAAFSNPIAGNIVTVNGDNSIQVVLIEDHKTEVTKTLEEVKADIEKTLREQEAPAYARIKGQELYDSWSKDSSKELALFATESKIQFADLKTYDKGVDPAPEFKGLTEFALGYSSGARAIYESGDNSILVQINEVVPETQPEFKTVAEKVFADYQLEEAAKLAKAKAEELSAKASSDFISLAKEAGYEVAKLENQKHTSREGILKNPEINKAAFSAKIGALSKAFEEAGKFYLINIDSVKAPEQKTIDEKISSYRERTQTAQQNEALEALIKILRAKAEIIVSPGLQGI